MIEVEHWKSVVIRTAGAICLSLSLFALAGHGAQGQPAQLTDANSPWDRSLKVLYAGRPDSDREKDFVAFLKKHFDVVRTGNARTFREADTQGFDVTLIDGDWTGFHEPRPEVSESFARPVMTLGAPGALLCSSWRLKTGYL